MDTQNTNKSTSTITFSVEDPYFDDLLPEIEAELTKVTSHLLLIPIGLVISALYLLLWFIFGL